VGTGPFSFVSYQPQNSMEVVRFDGYWGEKAKLEKVTFKIITDTNTLVMGLKGGTLDMVIHLPNTVSAEVAQDFTVLQDTMKLVQALYLNNNVKPFDDVRVRQALCYAVDKQGIIDLAFDGYGSPIGSSMYPAFGKYFDDSLTHYYEYNVEKAKELLSEAGYADGFSMTITVPSNYQPHVDTAQVIAEQLKAINVTAEIQLVEWGTWVSDIYGGRNFQTTVVGFDASTMTARALLERWTSDYAKNMINYNSAEYDQLFKQALESYDDAEQTAIYRQMAKNLTENAANVYIQDMADLVALRDGLEGVVFYPIYVMDLSGVRYTK
jgi:peptide/nickel transport system substrate-binding protein